MTMEEIQQAIRKAFPEGQVTGDTYYDGDSYYEGIGDEVRAALMGVEPGVHVHHRPPVEVVEWDEEGEPDDEELWPDDPRTYDILFLGPVGDAFEFEGTVEEEDWSESEEDFVSVTAPMTGHVGYVVGISMIAPFAAVQRGFLYLTESGPSAPDIVFGRYREAMEEEGSPFDDPEFLTPEAAATLKAFEEKLHAILARFGIQVLTEAELNEPIPGLAPDAEMQRITKAENATVGDALFFTVYD
jgi:hypothetical protein